MGLSLEYGGNGNYENHVVGFWGDFIVYITTASNVGTNRFGDYVTLRRQPGSQANPGNLFDAFGYGLNTANPPATGTRTDVRYVSFGRPASRCIEVPQVIADPTVANEDVTTHASGSPSLSRDPGTGHLRVVFTHESQGPVQGGYDIRGRLVKNVTGTYSPGPQTITWDGTDQESRPAASGIYILQLRSGASTVSVKGVWTR